MAQLDLYGQQGWPYADRRVADGVPEALEHGRTIVETTETNAGPSAAPAPWKDAYGDWSEYRRES